MSTPVVAILVAKPGMEQQLDTLLRGVIDTTLQEDGCRHYQLNRDLKNPRRFVWIEDWQSPGHLERHLAAAHIQAMFGAAAAYLESTDVIVLETLAGGAA